MGSKVTVKNLKNVQSSIKKFLVTQFRSQEARDIVANTMVDEIRDTTFTGGPSDYTKRARAHLEQYNTTHETYNRNKINITFTGELLDDLKKNVRVRTTENIEYVLEHSDKLHKGYNKKKGKTKRSSYKDISDGIQEHGYKYFEAANRALNLVVEKLNKFIIDRYKNF